MCNWRKKRKTSITYKARSHIRWKWNGLKRQQCLFMIAWFLLSIMLKYKLFISVPNRKNILNVELSWVELIKTNCFQREKSLSWVISERENFPCGACLSANQRKSGAINQRNNQQIIIWLTEEKWEIIILLIFFYSRLRFAARSSKTINNSTL